jgi:hypothetical protein
MTTNQCQIVNRTSGLADRYKAPSNHPTVRPDLQIRIRLCYTPSPCNIPEKKGYNVPFMKGFTFGVLHFECIISFLPLHKKYPVRRARGWNRSKDKRFFSHVVCLLGLFPGGKAAEEWSFHNLVSTLRMIWVELYLYSPHMLSWRGHGKTLILHNKQIPWNMSDTETVAPDDTECAYIFGNCNWVATRWQ